MCLGLLWLLKTQSLLFLNPTLWIRFSVSAQKKTTFLVLLCIEKCLSPLKCSWKQGEETKINTLFSLKTFSAHNSCFSQPEAMAEQAGANGADCLSPLCRSKPGVWSCYIRTSLCWACMYRVILSLALGLLSPPCAHGIKHIRRIAFKTQQDYKYQRAIQSPVPFLNTTLPIRCGPYRPPLPETSPAFVSTSWGACELQNQELVLESSSISVILWAAMKGFTCCALCCLTTSSFPHGCSIQGSQAAHKQLTTCLAMPSSLVSSHPQIGSAKNQIRVDCPRQESGRGSWKSAR